MDGVINITRQVTLTCTPHPNDASRITAYSWQKDGTNLAGEATQHLVFTSFAASDAGPYTCKTVDGNGESPASDVVGIRGKSLSIFKYFPIFLCQIELVCTFRPLSVSGQATRPPTTTPATRK